MESADGRKLYIGKSVKLSSRVPSYFTSGAESRDGEDAETSAVAATILPGNNVSRRIAVMTTLVER